MSPTLLARQALMRAGRHRSFRRRLPENLGGAQFPASVEGGLKFLRRDLTTADRVLSGFASRYVKQNQTVWDIGANVGFFTYMAAGLVGPGGAVVAVEADTWLVGNLRSLSAQSPDRCARVTVIPSAIDGQIGFSEFVMSASNRATNYLSTVGGSSMTGGVRQRQIVPTTTLDSLVTYFGAAPDVLKIDIEGAELGALHGATSLLTNSPPVVLIETARNPQQIKRLLDNFGYMYLDAETYLPCTSLPYNTIGLPPSF